MVALLSFSHLWRPAPSSSHHLLERRMRGLALDSWLVGYWGPEKVAILSLRATILRSITPILRGKTPVLVGGGQERILAFTDNIAGIKRAECPQNTALSIYLLVYFFKSRSSPFAVIPTMASRIERTAIKIQNLKRDISKR